MTKRQFISQAASPKVKRNALIAIVLTVASLLVLFLSANATINNAIWDIPLIKSVVDEDDREELEDSMDDADDALDQLEDIIDEYEDELDKSDKKLAKQLMTTMKNFVKKPSLNNAKKFIDFIADELDDLNDATDGELGFVEDMGDDFEEVVDAFDTLMGVIIFSCIFVGIFIAVGGLFQKTGFVITGLILAIPVTWLFGGIVMMLIGVVVNAVLISMCSTINQEYKIQRISAMI